MGKIPFNFKEKNIENFAKDMDTFGTKCIGKYNRTDRLILKYNGVQILAYMQHTGWCTTRYSRFLLFHDAASLPGTKPHDFCSAITRESSRVCSSGIFFFPVWPDDISLARASPPRGLETAIIFPRVLLIMH